MNGIDDSSVVSKKVKEYSMINLIKKLRDETGVNIIEINKTLELCNYDEDMTVEYLKVKYLGVNYRGKNIMDIVESNLERKKIK